MGAVSISVKKIEGIDDVAKSFALLERHFLKSVKESLDDFGKETKKNFKATVATWDTRPDFTYNRHESGDSIIGFVGTNDMVWSILNFGTNQGRWAKLSDDWVSKTTAAQGDSAFYSSGPGAGRVLAKGVGPFVDIEPRKWIEDAEEILDAIFDEYGEIIMHSMIGVFTKQQYLEDPAKRSALARHAAIARWSRVKR